MADMLPNLTQIQQTLQQINTAINALTQKIGAVFPIGSTITHTASAGADTLPANPAKFLTVTLPDGTTGKVPIYNP